MKKPWRKDERRKLAEMAFNARTDADYVKLVLPYPVSTNALYKPRYRGGVCKSEAYKAYQTACYYAIVHKNIKRISGKYIAHYTVCRPDNKERDIDNLWKCVSDILQQNGIIQNDSKCMKYGGEWAIAPDAEAGITIELWKYEEHIS